MEEDEDMMLTITIRSSDGVEYELEEQTAAKFLFVDVVGISHEISDGVLVMLQVNGSTLSKVVAYCEKHAEEVDPVVLTAWDDDFINVDDDILYNLITAAHMMGITSLSSLCARKFAEIIKGLTVDEIRKKIQHSE